MGDATTEQGAVVIERVFDAPVDRVWRMWTEPEHFAAWYGPDGVTTRVASMDVRVGGTRLVSMEMPTPDGPHRMWFAGEHREVVEPERLVYTEFLADEHGDPLSPAAAGVPDGHPATTEVIVELTEVDGGTRMVMTHVGVPADSPGATGWNMALDKLAVHLGEGA